MAINGTPAMSWGDFLNIPDGTVVDNHNFTECVALVNLYNEGVLGGGFVMVGSALEWWTNGNVPGVHGFERIASNPKVGDIGIASGGLYNLPYGHIFVVVRAWNGSSFGTMEQNGGARYVARYDRSMANVDGFLRPINQSALQAPAPSLSGDQRQAGSEGVFRRAAPSTASERLEPDLEAGVVGNFAGWIHGENVSGNDVWFQGISGHFFWSGAFTSASVDGLPGLTPVSTPPIVPVVVPVVETVTEPVVEPVIEIPIVDLPIVEVVEETPEEVDVPPTAVGIPRAYTPIGDTSAVFANLPNEGTITMKTGIIGAVTSLPFWNDLLTRAFNTFVQVAIAGVGVGAVGVLDLDYMGIINLAAGGALLSVLQSFGRATTPKS
jgi:hypothetical protein